PSRTDPMLTPRRLAPLSLALLLALSTSAASAAPITLGLSAPAATAAAPQKRQGIFKSMKVGFQAFREHRAAQGPGLIKRTLTKIGNGLSRLGDRIANRSEKIAKGAARMTIGVADTGRAVGDV